MYGNVWHEYYKVRLIKININIRIIIMWETRNNNKNIPQPIKSAELEFLGDIINISRTRNNCINNNTT